MALNSTHPNYAVMIEDWELMRDAYLGERQVKLKGKTYLPPTPGHELDGMENEKQPGYKAYAAYKTRAVFPDYVREAVERYIGLLHQKPPTIELPKQLEPLLDKATVDGESLVGLLRRINEQQLVTGRLGLMLDFPPNPDPTNPLPYIAMYYGEAARNWDNSDDHEGVNALTLVVLDESGYVRDDEFNWVYHERYRVLRLLPQTPLAAQEDGESADLSEINAPRVYMQGVFDVKDASVASVDLMAAPLYRGTPLEEIPFVFVNSKDILPTPDSPPLLGLGRKCMTIYRGEADYRHTLFMQGQETLVTSGTIQQNGAHVTSDDPIRVGAGAHLALDMGGDAKYIGVGAEGLAEQREALENDRAAAEASAGTMVSPSAGKQESGDALTTRLAAQTASLTQIAEAGAAALQNILRIAAKWMGADPEAVKVTPNTEFTALTITGQELAQLMGARAMGLPLSLESIHGVLRDRRLTKLDYDAELEKIAEEDARMPAPPEGAGGAQGNSDSLVIDDSDMPTV